MSTEEDRTPIVIGTMGNIVTGEDIIVTAMPNDLPAPGLIVPQSPPGIARAEGIVIAKPQDIPPFHLATLEEAKAEIMRHEGMGHGNALGITAQGALGQFEALLASFDQSDPAIGYKHEHSLRVAIVADEIARRMSDTGTSVPNGCDESVGFLMGLLHDVGRFPQWAMWKTYSDRATFPHAEMSYQMLWGWRYLRSFVQLPDSASPEDWPRLARILCDAIRAHSAFSIDDIHDPEARMYAGIIRDADKIDIIEAYAKVCTSPGFRLRLQQAIDAGKRGAPFACDAYEMPFVTSRVALADNQGHVSQAVYDAVMSHRTVAWEHVETAEDDTLTVLGLAFDMATDTGMERLRESGALRALAAVIPSLHINQSGGVDWRLVACIDEVIRFAG